MDKAMYENVQKKYTRELNRALPTQIAANITPALGTVDTLIPNYSNNFDPAQFTSLFAKDTKVYLNDKNCRNLPAPTMEMRDPSSRTGCGWWYVPNSGKTSTGAYGTRRGPMSPNLDTLYGTGEWIWDPAEAMKKEASKSSVKLKQCSDIEFSSTPNMGWCTSTNRPILTDGKGNPAFPNDPLSDCTGTIITSAAECNPRMPNLCSNLGAPSSDNSIRLYTTEECDVLGGDFYANGECLKKGSKSGSWSWDCRSLNGPGTDQGKPGSTLKPTCTNGSLSSSCIRDIVNKQCSDTGTLSQSLVSGYAGSSDTFNEMYAVLQERNFSIPSGIINDGKMSMSDAFTAVSKIKTMANDTDPRMAGAAKNLCFGSPYDGCAFTNTSAKPFSTSCIGRAALAGGWSPNGTAMPSKDKNAWSSLKTWGDVLNQITAWKNAADNYGPQQLDYIKKVYGIAAKLPNRCPSVILRENCDKTTGWTQPIPGDGTFYASEDFRPEAKYIIVPNGLTAILTSGNGDTHRVIGPGEFNFCSRNGFAGNVQQITVYNVKYPPATFYDNLATYQKYDRIYWNGKFYQLSQYIGAGGYAPDHFSRGSLWKAE